jgi:drug/metabolite transporter (DMT)-like permease
MMVQWYNFLVMVLATLIGAVGALYLKTGAERLKGTLIQKLFIWRLWLGLFLYGIATLLSFIVLRTENLSIIYALTSMSYVWVILISWKYLGEKINAYKIIAISLILVGIVLLTVK